MSANRKLLGEIQQVLKKVEEGVAIFDEIWEKVYAAEQQALKEKYEADLKKEIKKLQRLRDQIKTWIGSNEIKDKTQLMEARKIIETKMEQFKVCEKDTKTKAYSKEGLAREARLDPKEALKEEKRQWLNDCLDKLNDLIDSVEAEREKVIGSAKGKTKNKEALEKFDNRVQKHKWHMAKLELIIKLLDNDDLEPSLVSGIQDSLDYYIESAVDDDGALGVEHEFDIYEDLELDRVTTAAPTFDLSPRGVPAKEEEASPTSSPAAAAESAETVAEAESSSQPAPAKKAAVSGVPAAAAKATKAEPATQALPAAKAAPAATATANANAKISPKVTPATAPIVTKAAPTAVAKVSPKPAAVADDHNDAAKDGADSSAPASTAPSAPVATGMSWAAHAASAVPAAPVAAPASSAAPAASVSKAVPVAVSAVAGKSATNGAPAPAPAVASDPVASVAVADAPVVAPASMALHVPSPVSPVGTAQASPVPSVSSASSTPPPPPLQQQSKPNPELVVRALHFLFVVAKTCDYALFLCVYSEHHEPAEAVNGLLAGSHGAGQAIQVRKSVFV